MTPGELQRARIQMGLTQKNLAETLGLSNQTISLMERGETPVPKRTELAVRYLTLISQDILHIEGEEWRDVVGYEGLYQVSSDGRVFSYPRSGSSGGFPSVFVSTTDGYYYVNLFRPGEQRTRAVHILVAEAFLGLPAPGYEVSHEDGNRLNPHISNLKYRTRKDNLSLTTIHGTKLLGENTNSVVLTTEQVIEIKKLKPVPYCQENGYSAIARRYGVNPETIRRIFTGHNWSHINSMS